MEATQIYLMTSLRSCRLCLSLLYLSLSRVWLFATSWTVARQAPLSTGFSRQESWCGLPCPPPGDLLNPGIKPRSPALQADSLLTELQGKPKAFLKAVISPIHKTHTVSLLHMNLQVVNFQRCKHVFQQHQAWVKFKLPHPSEWCVWDMFYTLSQRVPGQIEPKLL